MEKRRAVLILILAVLLYVPWLGRAGFYTRGEPREALVVQNMLATGDWILPSGYGGVVPSKPPFFHWLGAIFSVVAGDAQPATVRLPSAVAAVLFLFFFFQFLARRSSNEQAFTACLMLMTAFEWARSAVSARVDMLLAVCLCSGLLALFAWWEQKLKGVPFAAIILLAAAALTKGPVGLLLPLAVFAAFLLLKRLPVKDVVLSTLKVCIPVLLLAGVWYAGAYLSRPSEFVDKVYYENVARFLGTQEDEPHKHSVFFLYGTTLLGLLPWSLFLISPFLKMSNFPKSPNGSRIREIWASLLARARSADSFSLFMAAAAASFLLFFSIPAGKRAVYLLPVYPFFAFGMAKLLHSMGERSRFAIYLLRLTASIVILVYVAVYLLLAERINLNSFPPRAILQLDFYRSIFQRSWESGHSSFLLLLVPALISLAALFAFKPQWGAKKAVLSLFALTYSLVVSVNALILPEIANALSGRDFASQLQELEKRKGLYSFGREYYALSFYMKTRIDRYEESLPTRGYVVLNEGEWKSFKRRVGFEPKILLRSEKAIVKPFQHIIVVELEPQE